ncbi:hypothetical protein BCE75_10690 [Isoptericola sp. CG 20/1183]|uniref:Uncharacterized protein n=1 Tax=Isoptericola halotolerans TaxID=300560 RepID=A0ABX5EDM0_9MICO|nr:MULTISPECIES: hypothetical protein [Isoptericola]PRZ06469.1 hypothetical protein BCL65_106144 [Isoptericola halotolerans]PRZ06725.1 hypothetical protein BCE75_10690 [Isoptericola sp. CG 20/1183]
MRTPLALGAAVLLALGLTAGPAAATGGGDRHWDGHGDSRIGDRWDGGEVEKGGKTYGWPEDTRTWGDNVCPDMDVAKTDVDGERETITLTAPEGKLISAYCVKAGSAQQGDGPKIVTLDEPVAEVTISYVAGGKCKAISHYAVAYVDAGTPTDVPDESTDPTPKPTPSTPDGETPPAEEPGDDPSDQPSPSPSAELPDETPEVPGGEEPGEPAVETEEPTTDESPDPRPQTVAPVEPGAGEGDEPRASEVAVELDADEAETVRAQTQAELPQTGPGRAIGITLGALALVGAGVGAVLYARSRRASA